MKAHDSIAGKRRLRHGLTVLGLGGDGSIEAALVPISSHPIYAPMSIASPAPVPVPVTSTTGSCSTSARKSAGTPASGDAANGGSPARWASSINRSIAARVRITTGCTHTEPLSIRAAGSDRSNATSSPRNAGDVSAGRSACERSSCRSRCQGSPLLIVITGQDNGRGETEMGQRSSHSKVSG